MAQTRKKRRRKHRGTQAGTVETFAHSSSKRGRAETQRARGARQMREPTWRSAANKAALAALVFGVLLVALFKRSVGAAAVWTVIVFFFYVPVGYWTDRAVYNRRKARLAAGKGKDSRR
jgi:uncharacterized membrane protein YoaK (UPF0700 family)